jgi:hypothetical protein
MLRDDYIAWDECPSADRCELIQEFCLLVDEMIRDIKHLQAEVIRTRYTLSEQPTYPHADGLKSDILSDLGGVYEEYPAFQEYMRIMYDGGNPLAFNDFVQALIDIARGRDEFKY